MESISLPIAVLLFLDARAYIIVLFFMFLVALETGDYDYMGEEYGRMKLGYVYKSQIFYEFSCEIPICL